MKYIIIILLYVSCDIDAQQLPDFGINLQGRSLSKEARQTALKNIVNLGATWVRDVPESGSEAGIGVFESEVKMANEQGLHVLLNVVQLDEDYDGLLQTNPCGWKDKRLSQINLQKFTARLQRLFNALKKGGLRVDAVEFGNEDDNNCYDADVPVGHAPTSAELKTWLKGYGEFLQTGVKALKSFYPKAKVISFGMAHGNGSGSFSDPAKIVAQLKNVDGMNYLASVDAYGTHIYASASYVGSSVISLMRKDVWALGRDKPFWLTEFGFNDATAFPNKHGQTLSQGLTELLDTLQSFSRRIAMGPTIFYSYATGLADSQKHSSGVMDANGNFVPAAMIFSQRYLFRK